MPLSNIKVVKMDEFMNNKRCPYCDSDAFVVIKESGQIFMTWRCAKCSKALLKEIIIEKHPWYKKILGWLE